MKNTRFGNRSRDNSRGSGRPTMHSAVCSECGKDCQVPFKPSGEKPIYCSNCFEKRGGGGRGNRNSRSGGSDLGLESINIKLDTIIRLLSSKGN